MGKFAKLRYGGVDLFGHPLRGGGVILADTLHDAGQVIRCIGRPSNPHHVRNICSMRSTRSEEHTSELQSLRHLVCRLLLEKKHHPSSESARAHLFALSAFLLSTSAVG